MPQGSGGHRRMVLALVLVSCLFSRAAHAQQNASVQGTIVDESAAVLPGATVTATETNTGVQAVAVAESDGRYRFDNLAPGTYKLRIELAGFASTEIPNVELLVGQNATVPRIAMKIASVEE